MIKAVLFDNDGVLSRWLLPRRKMRKLVLELRKHNVKTGMLSNVMRAPAVVYRFWKIYDGYDTLLLSYREKISKPNPKFYKLAIKKLGVKPHEILFIDNRAELLKPAQKLGIKTLHAKNTRQILADVKKIIKKENRLHLP